MITKEQKRWMLAAMLMFLSTSLLAVMVNSLEYGWHWEFSISRYVGLETWSVLFFALGNIGVAALFGKYLYTISEILQMPRWFYTLVVATIVALLTLSACPVGYFDLPGAFARSVPSQIHQVSSRLMFTCMLLMAFFWQLRKEIEVKMRRWCTVFVVAGVVCTVAFFGKFDWFLRAVLVFESAYLLGFMVLCWRLQGTKLDEKQREI